MPGCRHLECVDLNMPSRDPIEHLHAIAAQPFQWGVNDCCLAVADIIEGQTGTDLMGRFRGRYKTRIGWGRILQREGCETVGDGLTMLAGEFNLVQVDPGRPGELDIGLIRFRFDDRVFEAPAFYSNGFWHGRSHVGVLALLEAGKSWRLR